MSKLRGCGRAVARWLAADLFWVRGLRVRRLHGAALAVVLAIAAVLIFAVGVFVGYVYPYRTVPRPKVPAGQTLPAQSDCAHVMGGCLPAPKVTSSASITANSQGCDLSNNNPVYALASWRAIAAHNSFCIFKVTEGNQFDDPTAKAMQQLARSVGLAVGGYDFLHVCLVDPGSEGHRFAVDLQADHITGKGSLPPVGDAEWGGTGCNVRQWLTTWASAVYKVIGRHPWIYTGAWWWDPHVGAWWLPNALAWISGYVPWPPPVPAGRAQVDLWQFTSSGFNGATVGDLSTWRDGAAAFDAAAGLAPTTKPAHKPSRSRPGRLSFKPAVTVSRKRVVWATGTCLLGRCDGTAVLRAQVGLGKHNPVLGRWRHNVPEGKVIKYRFVLTARVYSLVRRHRIRVKADGNPHTFWLERAR